MAVSRGKKKLQVLGPEFPVTARKADFGDYYDDVVEKRQALSKDYAAYQKALSDATDLTVIVIMSFLTLSVSVAMYFLQVHPIVVKLMWVPAVALGVAGFLISVMTLQKINATKHNMVTLKVQRREYLERCFYLYDLMKYGAFYRVTFSMRQNVAELFRKSFPKPEADLWYAWGRLALIILLTIVQVLAVMLSVANFK